MELFSFLVFKRHTIIYTEIVFLCQVTYTVHTVYTDFICLNVGMLCLVMTLLSKFLT